ncbi:Predicted DNA-binding transcriptional regulator YafY, contains an HTH and WYL domains [Halanaerobium congolense]|jgi:predicted DNA-binding transcriptional regulator YafY|uniref:Predicted DNA-binding transcriptional regulator YafY, contains an HTH and WYL domains n=1 Tax=Halanaerobium congolense TaxID=54121 RepID=A0A1H9Z1C7_9FIRM|nr:YafY family protein [Halanaerobium congolense]PTX17585.1 putative DNA-binding transcriptional regulator YafY [Halanaerobium congolense]SDE95050.1 Predicted DNA-binding transcriptional regulator YafY, contains an HTH and WYL domains [Halanaerobium congolense]SES75311.1 Predicted DNA-binding transcriptional regulator YafY, contains an HTH and WYL domains [Halanaerobium congolense]SFP07554.1 Predicted DNA-binding transcriptional regulator YafY, contains an HTH and WYL domains [Halanaerobium con
MADKNRIFRIIKTIMLLNEPYKHWEAKDFAEYFEVSERTFHRDKQVMEELGVPIYYDNHLKEYKILDNFRFKAPNLDQKETEAVLLAAKEYQNRSFPMKKELESGLAKVYNSLPEFLKSSMGSYIKNYEIISDPFVELEKHQHKFDKLKEAINKEKRIEVNYYSMSSNQTTKRKLDPYNLFFNKGAPYLYAFCHLRAEKRIFRIDRIKELKLTAENFELPADFSLAEELDNAWGVEQGEEEMEVEVKFSGRAARFVPEYHWNDKQEIKDISENQIIFKVKTSSRQEIKKWILGYGAEAEVLQPKNLREEMKQEIEKMLENY